MQKRLAKIIELKTDGRHAEFARLMGWTPQYLHNMLKGQSMALQPTLKLLSMFPEINARWFLLGEGDMFNAKIDGLIGVEKQLREIADNLREIRETNSVKQL